MKPKFNFLMVLALLVMLFGASAGSATADAPVPSVGEMGVANMASAMSTALDTGTLWQNGEYGHFGVTSEENSYFSISSRTADDFELPSGCASYVVQRIRGQMLLRPGNVPNAYVEIYADSGGNGPVDAAPLYTFPMSSSEYLDFDSPIYVERYEFTFETPGLTLAPGHHWLSVYNVDVEDHQAYFAMTEAGVYQLQTAYWRAAVYGQPVWVPAYYATPRDAIFEIDGACAYPFTGFFSPVDNPPKLNAVKAGSGVPVKFSLGGDVGLDIFLAGYPKSQQVACDSGAPVAPVEDAVAAGASSLQYNPVTQKYTYVWKTDKAWAGTCREFVLGLNDGSDHTAVFKFK